MSNDFCSAIISSDSVELPDYNSSIILKVPNTLNKYKSDLKKLAEVAFIKAEITKKQEEITKSLEELKGIEALNSVDEVQMSFISNKINSIISMLESKPDKPKQTGEDSIPDKLKLIGINPSFVETVRRLNRLEVICKDDWGNKANIPNILTGLENNLQTIETAIGNAVSNAVKPIQNRLEAEPNQTNRSLIKKLTRICQSEALLLEVKGEWAAFYETVRDICPKLNILLIVSYDDYIKNRDTIDLILESSVSSHIGFGFISDIAQHREIISAIETVCKGECYLYPFNFNNSNVYDSGLLINTPEWSSIENQLIACSSNLDRIAILLNEIEKCKNDHIRQIMNLQDSDKALLNENERDKNIESLILHGLNNREIATVIACTGDDINKLIQYVRIQRLKLISHFIGSVSIPVVGIDKHKKSIKLSRREKKILFLIAQGYNNPEIAAKEGYKKKKFKEGDPKMEKREITEDGRKKIKYVEAGVLTKEEAAEKNRTKAFETVSTIRYNLKNKILDHSSGNPAKPCKNDYDSTIPMINQALRIGLLNLDDLADDKKVTKANPSMRIAPGTYKSSELMNMCEDRLITIIESLPVNEMEQLKPNQLENFIENLIVRRKNNWGIALILNSYGAERMEGIELVRRIRFQFILRIVEYDSLSNNGIKTILLKPDELEIIKLISKSKMDDDKNLKMITDEEIAAILNKQKSNDKEISIQDVTAKRMLLMTTFIDTPITDGDVTPAEKPDESFLYIPKKDGTVMGISLNELTVLDLIAAGLTNIDIAIKMGMTVFKVTNARTKLRRKFKIQTDDKSDRSICMVIKSYKLGLINLDSVLANSLK